MANIAFIGLGVMGYPMAGHLVRANHSVTVYNRTGAKTIAWLREHGGDFSTSAETPRDAAVDADLVMICVGNDNDVRSVALGVEGAIAGMKPGAVLIDHTTASAHLARQLANVCLENGCGFVDAPISGGEAGAISGQLTIMCGGDQESFGAANEAFGSYAKAVTLLGPAGSGQLTKMVNQICIAGILQGLSEGLNFAELVGLDPQQVVSAISKGAAQSWQMDNRAETMIQGQYDFGFATEWMQKDLGIALREGGNQGAALPVTALVNQFYAEVAAMGGKRWDTSSLIERLRLPRRASTAVPSATSHRAR